MFEFKRIWFVPSGSKNETAVPTTLNDWKIEYDRLVLTTEDHGRDIGYIYVFRCVPGAYSILKALMQGGNSFAPLEVTLGDKKK